MTASPGRLAAREVITRVRSRDAYAHETLDTVLQERKLDAREAAFATRLAYGAVASRGTLDEAIARFVSDPSKLEPLVSDALALSAYEILFAETPARAAVSQGVDLVKDVQPRAAGLANAVLRRLAQAAPEFPWGDPAHDRAALARKYAHPRWMVERIILDRSEDRALPMLQADNEPGPLFLADLPHRGADVAAELSQRGVETEPCDPPGCLRALAPAAAVKSGLLGKSVLVIDSGAQMAVAALNVASGGRYLEIGAGRGSKTLLAASRAMAGGEPARIVAVDLHAFKLERLTRAAADLGIAGVEVAAVDATDAVALKAATDAVPFDAILIDAPCSGLGTLRRHPDRRWRATREEPAALAALGGALLNAAAPLVKPGGFVVYSTCTVLREENEDVVLGFLASEQGRDFRIDSLEADVPAAWRSSLTAEGFLQTMPSPDGPDGHFVARLVRAT